ncbi:MAG: hypothetical protein MJ227_04875 [Bacilli bacterium]|nr:hypothetical protein [Bacilli bacterium]
MNNTELYNEFFKQGYIDYNNEKNIWIPEMEFLTPEKMIYRKNIYSELLEINDLEIFAITGGGDFFAWTKDDIVLFVEHDTGNCSQFALNLTDAIFRRIIEFASGLYVDMCSNDEKELMDEDDAEYYTSENDAITMLNEYAETFGKFFDQDKINCITEIVTKGFNNDYNAFITDEMLNKIISNFIKIDKCVCNIAK